MKFDDDTDGSPEDTPANEDPDTGSDSDFDRGWGAYDQIDYRDQMACGNNSENDLVDRAGGGGVTLECTPEGGCFSDQKDYLSGLFSSISEALPEALYTPIDRPPPAQSRQSPATPTERSSPWIASDMRDQSGALSGSIEGVRDFTLGVRDFLSNYSSMRDSNTKGADRYYHCMANCEATERGPGGEAAALLISLGREVVDLPKNMFVKGLSFEASIQDGVDDLAANRAGREGALSGVRCSEACQPMKPRGL